ncbi:MAG: lipid-A-disaccharide synthase [Gemmatimonadota bacterium]|nr:MAG: lipid-A-disaccharide synthase [Gemmatimonadota bacterium]
MMPSILISAGEVSGDLHGAFLVQEMQRHSPNLRFFGIGGNEMKAAGVELRYHIDRMGILGITEALRHLGFIRRVLKELRGQMEERPPDLVILIDYPGFNLRLAKIASQLSVPVLYYIAPQVWAWGARRIKTIARYVDTVAVILPFEKELYTKAGLEAEFVGHPLLERLDPHIEKTAFMDRYGFENSRPIVGLLPGSRSTEIRRLLPVMLETAKRMRADLDTLQIALATVPSTKMDRMNEILHRHNMSVPVIQGATQAVINASDLLLIASGTATLEAACYGTPSLILYKVSLITWIIAKLLVKLPYIGLVNIVAGKEIVPEYIQFKAQPGRVAGHALRLLKDEGRRRKMQAEMKNVRTKLGQPGASARTARIALNMLEKSQRRSRVQRDR